MEITFDDLCVHRTYVLRIMQLICRDYFVAEDMVHDSLIKAFDHRHQFEGRSSLRSWLVRVTINYFKEYFRYKPKFVCLDDFCSPVVKAPQLTSLCNDEIYNNIDYLDGVSKSIILMKLQGHDSEYIANQMGMSIRALNIKFFRIKSKFKKLMKSSGFDYLD